MVASIPLSSSARVFELPAAIDEVDLASPSVVADPYSFYEELRGPSGIARSRQLFGGGWLFTGFEDVRLLLGDFERLSNARFRAIINQLPEERTAAYGPLVDIHSRWMIFFDPPKHTGLRDLLAKGFTAKSQRMLEPFIARAAQEILAGLPPDRELDLLDDFCANVPLWTMAQVLGMPLADRDLFLRWTNDIASYMGAEKPDEGQLGAAQQSMIEFESYFADVVRERQRAPVEDDLLSLIVCSEEIKHVSARELFAQCSLLLFAGTETTKNLLGNAIYCALRDAPRADGAPRHWASELSAGSAALEPFVEEVLRLESPVQFARRVVRHDFTYNGAELRAGDIAVLLIGAANRDPRLFPNPGQLDTDRRLKRHLSFGHGVHFCLGQSLARVEATVALGALFERHPGVRLTSAPRWRNNPGFRGLSELSVHLGEA